MSGTAATGLGTWLVDWLPLAMAGGVGAACRWCSFQDLCPAFGNEPPPLPERAAQDVSPGAGAAPPTGLLPSGR